MYKTVHSNVPLSTIVPSSKALSPHKQREVVKARECSSFTVYIIINRCGWKRGNGGADVRRRVACLLSWYVSKKSFYRSLKCAPTCVQVYVSDVFVRLSSAWQTSKSIRALLLRLQLHYIVCLNMNCIPGIAAPPGSVRWDGMKSAAVVTHTYTLSHTQIDSQITLSRFLSHCE